MVAADVGQFIEPRESGIEIGEVGIDERSDGFVAADEFGDEAPGFFLHRGLQSVNVIGRKRFLGGRHGAELVQAEPLLREEAQETITAR